MKTAPIQHSNRRQWITGVLMCSACAVRATPPAKASSETAERTPKQGAMGAVLIAKVVTLAPLGAEEAAQSGRRMEFNLVIESQVGLNDDMKTLRLRCNGLARIFGAKNEEIAGKVFLFRLLENPVEPYGGKFEVWRMLGGHP